MKYVVQKDNLKTEFADLPSAQSYAIDVGVPVEYISTVPDEIPLPPPPSSVEVFEQKVAAGFPIPGTPYSLALEDKDRAQFTGMLTMVRELLDAGYITNETPQSLKDKDDNIITVTTGEFRGLMIAYGIYYKTIWNECDPKS